MGADHSKWKSRKGSEQSHEKVQKVEQHKEANVVNEGSSVDNEMESCMPEGPTSGNNEDEVYTSEEQTEDKLTGLPGEAIPVLIAPPCVGKKEILETNNSQEVMKAKATTVDGLNNEISFTQEVHQVPLKCENQNNSYKETDILENRIHESEKVDTDIECDECNQQNEELWDIGPIVNEYYSEFDSGRDTKEIVKESLDCTLNTEESSGTSKVLKDFKVARENFELPLHFDSEGKFKKKATSENDDNRAHCDMDDDEFSHATIVKPTCIFTNVIFLPDKSKGASPKRYGPKRLGSVYDGIPEEDNDSDINSESSADDKSLQSIPMTCHIENDNDINELDNIAERERKTDRVEISMSRERREFKDLLNDKSKLDKVDTKSADDKVEETIEDEKNSTNLFFVEDHFGLYTGSIAEGLSTEFKEERTSKQNYSNPNHAVLPHVKGENTNDENIKVKESNLDKFSHDTAQSHKFEQTGNVEELKLKVNDDVSNSQALNLPTSKVELDQEWKPHKAKEKDTSSFNDTLQEQEIVEICKNCREPRELCFCLFQVMPVLFDYQQKPPLAYLRYMRINDKEINWSVLKSAQAIFLKGIKSHNTEISEDNRIALKFELPASKGFLEPQKGHENIDEEFEHDNDYEHNAGISMVRSIESELGFDVSGLKLNGSISSFRNIIVNDFDECSDTDEEICEEGDWNGEYDECEGENNHEENFDLNITDKTCKGVSFHIGTCNVSVNVQSEGLTVGEGSSLIVDEESSLEESSLIVDEESILEESSLIVDEESILEESSLIVDEESILEESSILVDEESSLIVDEESSLEESSLIVNEELCFQNDCNTEKELLCKQIPQDCYLNGLKIDRCMHLGSSLNIQSEVNEKDTIRNKEVNSFLRNTDDIKQSEQLLEGQCHLNIHDLHELRNKEESETDLVEDMAEEKGDNSLDIGNLPNDRSLGDSISLSSEDNIVLNDIEIKCEMATGESELKTEEGDIEMYENKIEKCAITSINIDSSSQDVNVDRECIEEDNDGLKELALQSNEGNKCVPTVSSSVVTHSGNKFSENTSVTTSSSIDIENGEVQEKDGILSLRQYEHGFSLENETKEVALENREHVLLEEENLDSVCSQLSVDTLEIPVTKECQTSNETRVCDLPEKVSVKGFKDKFNDKFAGDFNAKKDDEGSLKFEDMKTMKTHLGGDLRRKLTNIDDDNRFVEISSDDEEEDAKADKCVGNKREEVQYGKKRIDLNGADDEDGKIVISGTVDEAGNISFIKRKGGGKVRSSGENLSDFLSSGNLGSSLMQMQGSLFDDLSAMTDLDSPSQLLKHLQERKRGMLDKMVNVNDHSKTPARRHSERRPRRPDQAKSDFAASFYDSSDRNVDITKLVSHSGPSSQTSLAGPFPNDADDSDNESIIHDHLERHVPERIIEPDFRSRTTMSSSSTSVSFPSSSSDTPVPSIDSSNDEEIPEVKLNEFWNPVLQEERNNCLQGTKIPSSYRCTVLCVDVSESMQGFPWQQVEQFVPEFLSGLEKKKHDENIEEFVAMVTFGYKTKILTQPAKNFTQLSKDFNSLKPEGNSPMLPGIALSFLIQTIRKELGQPYCKLHDIVVRHRIILISDGQPSPTTIVSTSDDFPDLIQQEACQEVEASLQEWKLPTQSTHIDCVPVGSNPNLAMLETICRVTNGRLVKLSDVQDLINSTHNHYIAAQISKQMFREKADPFNDQIFQSLVLSLYQATSQTDLTEMKELITAAQTRLLTQQLEGADTMSIVSEEDSNFEPKDLRNLPNIGTRVATGPDVTDKLVQLNVGRGTITGHSRKHSGKVFVHWDNGVNTLCNCGFDEKFEVFPTDSKDQCNVDDQIKVGHKVRRGPDWKYGNQDGGGDQLGTVIKIHRNGNILVKWPNGNQNKYRYNQCGIFDLLISDPDDPLGTKVFESEMNKRNQARSDTPEQLHDKNRANLQFPGNKSLEPTFLGDYCVRPKFFGDNSVRPKVLGNNSMRSNPLSENGERRNSLGDNSL